MTVSRSQPSIEQRLRDFRIWNRSQSHYEPVTLCNEAANHIADLEAELAISRRCNKRVDCLCRGEVMDHAAAVGDRK
jgi:hypothetical protein